MRTAAITAMACLLGLVVGFAMPVGTKGAIVFVALVLMLFSGACGLMIEKGDDFE